MSALRLQMTNTASNRLRMESLWSFPAGVTGQLVFIHFPLSKGDQWSRQNHTPRPLDFSAQFEAYLARELDKKVPHRPDTKLISVRIDIPGRCSRFIPELAEGQPGNFLESL